MKCIRNNWLNQTDKNQTFVYPPIFESMKSVMRLLTNALNASSTSSCSPAVAAESILQNVASSGTAVRQSISLDNAQRFLSRPDAAQTAIMYVPTFFNGNMFMVAHFTQVQQPTLTSQVANVTVK